MQVHRLASDFGLYIMGEGPEALYLALYVDDVFLLCIRLATTFGVKRGLGKRYNMKDMGEAKFLLGLEIRRQRGGNVFLVQEKHAKDLLTKFGMQD